MATGKILAHASIAVKPTELLVEKANHLPVGNPATEQVALGPVLNQVRDRERQTAPIVFRGALAVLCRPVSC